MENFKTKQILIGKSKGEIKMGILGVKHLSVCVEAPKGEEWIEFMEKDGDNWEDVPFDNGGAYISPFVFAAKASNGAIWDRNTGWHRDT